MPKYVVLLRGINVGGRNKLPMAALRGLLAEMGCQEVQTLIQSGNAVVQAARKPCPRQLAGAIERDHGFQCPVFVLTAAQFRNAAENNPFPDAVADPKSLHVVLLDSAIKQAQVDTLQELADQGELLRLAGKILYLHTPLGMARSRVAKSMDRVLGVTTTARNWQTISKLVAMLA